MNLIREPPPALTSDGYTRVFNEVKSLGEIDSKARTSDQTVIGNFWNGNIQDFWKSRRPQLSDITLNLP